MTTERPPTLAGDFAQQNGLKPGPLDAGMVRLLRQFPPETTDVQSRYVIVHQLRASADIQDGQTKRETGWATTSDRADLMRRAADTIEAIIAFRLVEEASPVGGGVRERLARAFFKHCYEASYGDTSEMADEWAHCEMLADQALAVMSPRDEGDQGSFSQEAKIPTVQRKGRL